VLSFREQNRLTDVNSQEIALFIHEQALSFVDLTTQFLDSCVAESCDNRVTETITTYNRWAADVYTESFCILTDDYPVDYSQQVIIEIYDLITKIASDISDIIPSIRRSSRHVAAAA